MISSKNLLRSVSYRVKIKCFHSSSPGPMGFQTNEKRLLCYCSKQNPVGAELFFYAAQTIYLRSIDALYTHAVMFMTSFIQYT